MAEHHHHHHHHHSIEKERKNKKIKRIVRVLFVVALVMLIPYLAIEFFPFVRSIFAHNKINMSTVCYTFLRIALLGIPIIITMPSKPYKKWIEKTDLLSKWFAVTSFLFFTGLVADIMSYNIFGGYEDLGEDPVMLKMLWGNIGINGLVFCFVQGLGYLFLWKKIKSHKKDVVLLFAATYALYLIMPFAFMIITHIPFGTDAWHIWFDKNIWFYISNVFFLAGLIVCATTRRAWSEIIWK
ncbi:MAG: hypothetical protein IJ366_02905 [Clostridia bacterium]|nr:hypothetical protein [Clostridia bacterium]